MTTRARSTRTSPRKVRRQKTNGTTQSDRLTEAQSQVSQVSGVNLDQQLSNMVTYQQAYSAGARIMQTAQALFTTLLQIPSN
jgi:flagellar hook-associated protein 1 FlgK